MIRKTNPLWIYLFALLCAGLLFGLVTTARAEIPAQVQYQTPTAGVDGRILYKVAAGDSCLRIGHDAHDVEGVFAQRYDARPGTSWLVRPDQHLAARFRDVDAAALAGALRRSLGWELKA